MLWGASMQDNIYILQRILSFFFCDVSMEPDKYLLVIVKIFWGSVKDVGQSSQGFYLRDGGKNISFFIWRSCQDDTRSHFQLIISVLSVNRGWTLSLRGLSKSKLFGQKISNFLSKVVLLLSSLLSALLFWCTTFLLKFQNNGQKAQKVSKGFLFG